MTRRILALTLAALLGLGGCLPTLNAVYRPADLTYNPAVLGTWRQPESQATWQISQRDATSYRVVLRENGEETGRFIACLAKIEGRHFLDLYPEDVMTEMSGLHKMHLIPMHTVYLVRKFEPTLELAAIDYRWLEQYLEDHPHAIQHARFDSRVILTAPTDQVRAFVIEHAELFNAQFVLERASND